MVSGHLAQIPSFEVPEFLKFVSQMILQLASSTFHQQFVMSWLIVDSCGFENEHGLEFIWAFFSPNVGGAAAF